MKKAHFHQTVTCCVTLALAAMASLPQGYMVQRGAGNLVEIVICRSFDQQPTTLYLNIETGEYVEGENAGSHHSNGGSSNVSPCHFSVVKFSGPSMAVALFAVRLRLKEITGSQYSFDVAESFYVQPGPRAPPV